LLPNWKDLGSILSSETGYPHFLEALQYLRSAVKWTTSAIFQSLSNSTDVPFYVTLNTDTSSLNNKLPKDTPVQLHYKGTLGSGFCMTTGIALTRNHGRLLDNNTYSHADAQVVPDRIHLAYVPAIGQSTDYRLRVARDFISVISLHCDVAFLRQKLLR